MTDKQPTTSEFPGEYLEIDMEERARAVCSELLAIMRTYHEQEDKDGYVNTPGGLEHMGDVWRLFLRWEEELLNG